MIWFRLRHSQSGIFVLSLALSDLLVAVFIIPLKMSIMSNNLHFCSPVYLCRGYVTMDNILFVASITNLFVLTVDRYMGLQYGFGFTYNSVLTKRRARLGTDHGVPGPRV